MKIKLKRRLVSKGVTYPIGAIVELDTSNANILIQFGQAEQADEVVEDPQVNEEVIKKTKTINHYGDKS